MAGGGLLVPGMPCVKVSLPHNRRCFSMSLRIQNLLNFSIENTGRDLTLNRSIESLMIEESPRKSLGKGERFVRHDDTSERQIEKQNCSEQPLEHSFCANSWHLHESFRPIMRKRALFTYTYLRVWHKWLLSRSTQTDDRERHRGSFVL